MTRLQAAAAMAPDDRPVVAMDTAPAAVLGALEDPAVCAQQDAVVANVGNFHTLAFHLHDLDQGPTIAGLFEHHTGLLDQAKLEDLLRQLAAGTLSHEALFAEHGHGALLLNQDLNGPARTTPTRIGFLAITGPRRGMLAGSVLRPYLAVPYGDMMMAGCWGLIRACAAVLPWTAGAIGDALRAV
jgi:hypothetical protein